MLVENIMEPAQTELAARIVYVPSKDGTFYFFVDYRKLNASTKQDSYLQLRVDESIALLGEATVLSKLDANSG